MMFKKISLLCLIVAVSNDISAFGYLFSSQQAIKYEAIAEYAKGIIDGEILIDEVSIDGYNPKLDCKIWHKYGDSSARIDSIARINGREVWIKQIAAKIYQGAKEIISKEELDRGYDFGQLDNMPLHTTEGVKKIGKHDAYRLYQSKYMSTTGYSREIGSELEWHPGK